ncbi:MAG: AAA family ATPase [Lentisphaeraceae bacterium]|nr:AAA family ATPase [Lentisphaeraceae bacterium]
MIIGIYGIAGVGKTHLTHKIEQYSSQFKLIDGSAIIEEATPGGLSAFKKMNVKDKYRYREAAIQRIKGIHDSSSKHIIVAGHYSLFRSSEDFEVAWTKSDAEVYDYIFSIEASAVAIKQQCLNDLKRQRNELTEKEIDDWQSFELLSLANICKANGIHYSQIKASDIAGRVVQFFKFFSEYNINCIGEELLLLPHDCFALFDCDGTLFAGDCLDYIHTDDAIDTNEVCSFFKKRKDYCFESFFEVAHYYSGVEAGKMTGFISRAGDSIELSPLLIKKLRQHSQRHSLVWITSGFQEVWENVARRYELDVKVIGGNNLAKNPAVVSNEEKTFLVKKLIRRRKVVYAYGDSMADSGMLLHASQATVVISKKRRDDLFESLKGHQNLSIIDIRN